MTEIDYIRKNTKNPDYNPGDTIFMRKGFSYYNPRPDGTNVGDCAVRALTKISRKPYNKVLESLEKLGKKVSDDYTRLFVVIKYINKNLNIVKEDSYGYDSKLFTIGTFQKRNPKGRYIVYTSNHIVAIENGILYDSFDSSKCRVRGWFKIN